MNIERVGYAVTEGVRLLDRKSNRVTRVSVTPSISNFALELEVVIDGTTVIRHLVSYLDLQHLRDTTLPIKAFLEEVNRVLKGTPVDGGWDANGSPVS